MRILKFLLKNLFMTNQVHVSNFGQFQLKYFLKHLVGKDMQLLRIQDSYILNMQMLMFCIYLRKEDSCLPSIPLNTAMVEMTSF